MIPRRPARVKLTSRLSTGFGLHGEAAGADPRGSLREPLVGIVPVARFSQAGGACSTNADARSTQRSRAAYSALYHLGRGRPSGRPRPLLELRQLFLRPHPGQAQAHRYLIGLGVADLKGDGERLLGMEL